MKIHTIVAALFALLPMSIATADDQTNYTFDKGSVIIHCSAPSKEEQLDTSVFNEAFPLWITNLQVHANEGRVGRAFYLNELKQGMFVVVTGETAVAAMENALAIHAENQAILKAAMKKAGMDDSNVDLDESCDLIEIGPVAIVPSK